MRLMFRRPFGCFTRPVLTRAREPLRPEVRLVFAGFPRLLGVLPTHHRGLETAPAIFALSRFPLPECGPLSLTSPFPEQRDGKAFASVVRYSFGPFPRRLEELQVGRRLPRAAQKPVRFSQGTVTRRARRKRARRDSLNGTPFWSFRRASCHRYCRL